MRCGVSHVSLNRSLLAPRSIARPEMRGRTELQPQIIGGCLDEPVPERSALVKKSGFFSKVYIVVHHGIVSIKWFKKEKDSGTDASKTALRPSLERLGQHALRVVASRRVRLACGAQPPSFECQKCTSKGI